MSEACPHLTVRDGGLFWRGVYMPRCEARRLADTFTKSRWSDPPFADWSKAIRSALKETAQ